MQVNSLMNVEVKKKYEFLESISAIMDAHLRYFKLVRKLVANSSLLNFQCFFGYLTSHFML